MYCDKMRDIIKHTTHNTTFDINKLTHARTTSRMSTGGRLLGADEAARERGRSSGHRDYWRPPMAQISLDDVPWGPERPDRGVGCLMLRTYDPDPHESELTRRARWAAQQDAELRAGSVGTPRTFAAEVYNTECRWIFRINYPGLALRATEDVCLSCPLRDSTEQPCNFKTNDLRLIAEHFRQFPLHEAAGKVTVNRCLIRFQGEEPQLSAAEQVVFIGPHPATPG